MSAFFSAAVETARRIISRIDLQSLPSAVIDSPNFSDNLPTIPAVYFVFGRGKKPVYIGKAVNLRNRWKLPSVMGNVHAKLRDSLNLKGAHLRWLEMPKDELLVAEVLLIQHYAPKWNSCESPKKARTPRTLSTYTADDFRKVGMWDET